MKIIADSGSSKTDWIVCNSNTIIEKISTIGINPTLQDDDQISETINTFFSQITPRYNIDEIAYYGAGVRNNQQKRMIDIISQIVEQWSNNNSQCKISAESDLLGAARALFGKQKGTACILGTGSNSCVYDGENIVENIPPLGYILGDEGGGATLGNMFVNRLYKQMLPKDILEEFEKEMKLSIDEIINKVYKQPLPNRFLASFSPFILRHISNRQVEEIVVDNFRLFFKHNIKNYSSQNLPIGFIGSIAFYFKEQLINAANDENLEIDNIQQSPIKGLMEYHFS